jgi:hypothetical protein
MSNKPNIPTYKGRNIGIAILVGAQMLIGAIHVFFGLFLLAFEPTLLKATVAYDFYTVAFGALILVFAMFIWQGKMAGWVGTVAVSLFVIVVDSLAVLNLPTIPGVPAFPAYTEIPYSILIVTYLSTDKVRKKLLK